MEAATLVPVTDSISKGASFLPSAGSGGTLAGGTVGSGSAPTAAINSGTKLDGSLLSPTSAVSNGQGRQYASNDNPSVKGVAVVSEGTKAGNE